MNVNDNLNFLATLLIEDLGTDNLTEARIGGKLREWETTGSNALAVSVIEALDFEHNESRLGRLFKITAKAGLVQAERLADYARIGIEVEA